MPWSIKVYIACFLVDSADVSEDQIVIALCVAGYFSFTGLVSLIDFFVTKTSVLCIKVAGDSVFVDVTMQQFSSEIELGVRSLNGKKVTNKCSVGRFFDSDGYLHQENMHEDFLKLVKRYEKEESGKKGGEKEKKKDK